MTISQSRTGTARKSFLIAVLILQLLLVGTLVYAVAGLRAGLETTDGRSRRDLAMVLSTYTLRQSSDYLTRFARRYAVTGDPAWRDVYQQVLDIRRGDALRPKDYESIYWDLIEPYRSNAHPLLYPQSLRSILEGLPFTPEELDLLREAEDNSEALASVETAAFLAVEQGRREEAIEALFSVDYLRAKHTIMQPIDELMVNVRKRVQEDWAAALAEDERLMDLVVVAAGGLFLINLLMLVLLLRARNLVSTPPSGPDDRDGSEGEAGQQSP